MAATFKAKRQQALRRELQLVTPPAATLPPSAELINVILEYADVQQDVGGGRFILRLSQRRMKDPVVRRRLGRETHRLSDISILWDEDAGQMIRLYDEAQPADDRAWPSDADCELDTFELTEAALDYIANHGARQAR
jgi:hypothetical protein